MNLYFPLKIDINSKQIIVLSLYYALIKRQKQKDIKIRKKQKALKIRKKQPKIQRKIIDDEFRMEDLYTNLTDSDWNERENHKFQRKPQIRDILKIKYVSLEPTLAMDVEMEDEFRMEDLYTNLKDSDWNEIEHNFQIKNQIGDILKIKSVSLEPNLAMDVEMEDDFGMEHIYTDLTDSDWNERENHKF